MSYSTLTVDIQPEYAIITLQRPDKLNALNHELLSDLRNALNKIKELSTSAVIITGSGQKAFAAGADIEELHQCDAETGKAFAQNGHDVFSMIENFSIPVIAAVNGFALGGGCELALACHIRFASTAAKFGQPEVKLGIIPGYGGTQRLTRLCGRGIATELICGGGIITAQRALNIGLVNDVVEPDQLMLTAISLAKQIASVSPLAVMASLNCIASAVNDTPANGFQTEITVFGELCSTQDFKEGTRAFIEKRAANFKGY